MSNLLACMEKKREFSLEQFNQAMAEAYSEEILKNGDYFSFFVNLCQKKEYIIGGENMHKESFLDDILIEAFVGHRPVQFAIEMNSDNSLELFEGCEVTDVIFTVE